MQAPIPSADARPRGPRPGLFFLLTFVLAVPFWILGALAGVELLPGLPVAALMFVCPGIAGLILAWQEGGARGARALLARSLDFRRTRSWLWYAPVLLFKPCVAVLSYLALRLTGAPVPAPDIALPHAAILAVMFFVAAEGEELGWSGYATDPLQERWGALRGALILGCIWAAIHFVPLAQAHRSVSWIAWWSLGTVASRVVMVWLYNNTGRSVAAVALFHMTSNVCWQLFPVQGSFFDPRIEGVIVALAAAVMVTVWGPRTLTGRRRAIWDCDPVSTAAWDRATPSEFLFPSPRPRLRLREQIGGEAMDQIAPHRARSMAEMGGLMGRMFQPEKAAAAMQAFRPRPTDIVIAPAGKCGTTWLQQTFHTLRTRGDMDFDDISRVVPWIETAGGLEIDLNAPQRAEPRGFKSHLPYDDIPKGARYVVSLRDPKDALVSMHRFMDGWFLEPGAVSVAEFAQLWLTDAGPGGSYWRHLLSWWAQRDNPNVLLLSYEHMSVAPEAHVRRLADFCGIPLDDDLLALTLENSSLAFMLAHKDRFDDAMMRQLSERVCNLPPGSDSSKVRQGKVGGHRQDLDAETGAALDAKWAATITPVLGFPDYAALEADLRRHAA